METVIPPPVAFKDRKAGLIVFGVLTLLAGCLSASFVPLTILAQSMTATHGGELNYYTTIPAVVLYGSAAIALIWLGIGSILTRRWARALLLIASWSALFIGSISAGMMAFMVRRFPELMRAAKQPGQPELPPGMDTVVIVIIVATCLFLYVFIPLIWVLFYGSRHVKATCEVRDPVIRWTDRCPLPVLAVSLWLVLGILMMLTVPVAYHGVFPFLGMFLTGVPGSLLNLVMAALWAYCAWAFYKLDWRGWWILIVALIVFAVSGTITYSRHDIIELYRLIGYPEKQIELIQKVSFVTRDLIVWGTLVSFVPVFGYLLYVRRFFPRGAKTTIAP